MKKTSKIAAKMAEVSGLKSAHYKKILSAMSRFKKNAPNYREIARAAGLEPVQVARRLGEMCGLGLIVGVGVNKTISGRPATTYKMV